LKNKNIDYSESGIIIDNVFFSYNNEYNEYFEIQDSLIEFVAVTFLYNRSANISNLKNSIFVNQTELSRNQAQVFSGYPDRFLNRLIQEKHVRSRELSNGEIRVNKQDLYTHLIRGYATFLEELV